MNILMFNMANYRDWRGGVVNRNFFVLKNLLADPSVGKILAVDFLPLAGPAPFGLKRAFKYYWQNIVSRPAGRLLKADPYSRLYQASDKFLVYSSLDFYLNPDKFAAKLEAIVREQLNGGKLVSWNYNPFMAAMAAKLPADLRVFDMVDNWGEHASFSAYRSRLSQAYEVIGQTSDMIFTVARELRTFFGKDRNVFWVPNGVELEHFASARPCPPDVKNLKRPIIGYVGTIQERIDFDLLASLARQNTDKSLLLVGPVWDGVKNEVKTKLGGLANVHFTGRRPYRDNAAYIQQFDVAIIPHKIGPFIKSTNPMKMYEYLAAGRPVVSTPGAGVDMFKDFMSVAGDTADFNRLVQLSLHEDSPLKRAGRQTAVSSHSWVSRVGEMSDIIKKAL